MDSSHVVMISFPAQGHIKPMLMLAELLSRADIRVSFVNTEHSHRRIDRHRCPGITFLSIPDGLPPDHPRSGPSFIDLLFSITTVCKPHFKDMVASMSHAPSCIISDGIMPFAIDVAEELGIPAITFRTYSATSTWLYFHLHHLIQDGHIPVLQGSEEMEKQIGCIPGLENIIRVADLPTICKLHPQSHILQIFLTQASTMRRASALVLNTFEELESPFISHLHSIFPAVYAIGPLHTAINSTFAYPTQNTTSSSLLQFDQSCMDWLDSQPSKSVLYVSFGSLAVLTHHELMEVWYGLVNSETSFLWAIRPGLIWDDKGPGKVPEEVKMGTTDRGRIVGWAPQEDVLAHDAVGGFFTHCGWNSTLESMSAGKPMICRPVISEQPVNSRCVSEMWKVGIEMKGIFERSTVEKLVRDLMEGRKVEIVESSVEIAKMAQNSVRDAGSSNRNLKKLIQHIKSMHSSKANDRLK